MNKIGIRSQQCVRSGTCRTGFKPDLTMCKTMEGKRESSQQRRRQTFCHIRSRVKRDCGLLSKDKSQAGAWGHSPEQVSNKAHALADIVAMAAQHTGGWVHRHFIPMGGARNKRQDQPQERAAMYRLAADRSMGHIMCKATTG